MISATTIKTPTGYARISASTEKIVSIEFCDAPEKKGPDNPLLDSCAKELTQFFAAGTRTFSTPLHQRGSVFQKAVWKALQKVPYGEVVTYGELALMAGYPKAARAVGSACKNNPFPFIIPCHRVLPASKSLGGYAGGAAMKQWLLDSEKRN
jgi:methylated-DNA-[protein]-cysteine S-methyltransferase